MPVTHQSQRWWTHRTVPKDGNIRAYITEMAKLREGKDALPSSLYEHDHAAEKAALEVHHESRKADSEHKAKVSKMSAEQRASLTDNVMPMGMHRVAAHLYPHLTYDEKTAAIRVWENAPPGRQASELRAFLGDVAAVHKLRAETSHYAFGASPLTHDDLHKAYSAIRTFRKQATKAHLRRQRGSTPDAADSVLQATFDKIHPHINTMNAKQMHPENVALVAEVCRHPLTSAGITIPDYALAQSPDMEKYLGLHHHGTYPEAARLPRYLLERAGAYVVFIARQRTPEKVSELLEKAHTGIHIPEVDAEASTLPYASPSEYAYVAGLLPKDDGQYMTAEEAMETARSFVKGAKR